MRKLGLIGGTSWHSTIEYYRHINQAINAHFGNNTNPPLMIYTLNQAKVHKHQIDGQWTAIGDMLIEAANSLERAGADELMFCANTPHKVYDYVGQHIQKPIIHIADATAIAIKSQGIGKVCFLGTRYSMTEEFITQRIADNNIEVVVPDQEKDITELHRIIQEELTYGNVLQESKKYVISIVNDMIENGAEGVVLGCTEFPLMLTQEDLKIPIFNTTTIHAQAGVNSILYTNAKD